MDVIRRNYISLLRTGALQQFDVLEPMSTFKWIKLYELALSQAVLPFIIKGMKEHKNDENLNVPQSIQTQFEQQKELNNKNAPSFEAKLFNKLLNNRYLKILYKEKRATDSSPATLTLLNYIIANIHHLLSKDISVRLLLEMARWIRTENKNIDFSKLDKWLSQLHLVNLTSFLGSLLMALFKLEKEDLPFIKRVYPRADEVAQKALQVYKKEIEKEKTTKISMGGMIQNTPTSMTKHLKLCSQYFSYAPIEAGSSFFVNYWQSLSDGEDE